MESDNQSGTDTPSAVESVAAFLESTEEQATEPQGDQPQAQLESEPEIEATEEVSPDEGDDSFDDIFGAPEPEETTEQELFEVTVDGQLHKATLDELKKGYSQGQNYTSKTMALAEERKSFESKFSQKEVELEQKLSDVSALIYQYSQTPTDNYSDAELAQLKVDDPELWTQTIVERQQRQQEIALAQLQVEQLTAERQAKHNESKDQFIASQRARLLDKVPALKDEAKLNKAKEMLGGYMQKEGFTVEEMKELVDHRVFIAMLKAARWDAAQSEGLPSKRVKPKSKYVKSNGAAPTTNVSERHKKTLKRAKATGRVSDAAAALIEGGFVL